MNPILRGEEKGFHHETQSHGEHPGETTKDTKEHERVVILFSTSFVILRVLCG